MVLHLPCVRLFVHRARSIVAIADELKIGRRLVQALKIVLTRASGRNQCSLRCETTPGR